MQKWVTRISRAAMMGLAWAVVWMPIAALIGARILDPDNSMDEMWGMAGAVPGFLCGTVFVAIAGIAAEHRRLIELSIPRSAALGAMSGLLVSVLWSVLAVVSDGLATWKLDLLVIGSVTLMSVISAVTSTLVARTGRNGKPLDTRSHAA